MTDNGLLLIRRPLCSYCSDPSAFIAPAPCGAAIQISGNVRPLAQIDADAWRPAQHREQISIGAVNLSPIRLPAELLVDPVEALAEKFPGKSLEFFRRGRTEQQAEGLVQFRSDVVQPFLDAVAIDRSGRAGMRPEAGF
jgi:hypothetical protein